jgi:hypothetical protein
MFLLLGSLLILEKIIITLKIKDKIEYKQTFKIHGDDEGFYLYKNYKDHVGALCLLMNLCGGFCISDTNLGGLC